MFNMAKTMDLGYLVERLNVSAYVAFTQTFLDNAKLAKLDGYIEVSRLERRTGETQGCIFFYAKKTVEKTIVHVGDSEEHERV